MSVFTKAVDAAAPYKLWITVVAAALVVGWIFWAGFKVGEWREAASSAESLQVCQQKALAQAESISELATSITNQNAAIEALARKSSEMSDLQRQALEQVAKQGKASDKRLQELRDAVESGASCDKALIDYWKSGQ